MATQPFEVRVEGLTSINITASSANPSQEELTEFLKDGVIDVTNRWLSVKPQDAHLFTRSSSESTSQGGLSNSDGKIISVVREAGTDGDWRSCIAGTIALQSRYTDTDSLHFASKYNPKYVIGGDGAILTFPAPGGSENAYKVYYVNSTPVNSSDATLINSHSDINYFPLDKVYLVVIYASMKTVQAAMGATTISDLSITAVPPDVPSLSTITFDSIDAVDSTLTVVAAGGVLGSATLPTYTKPTITTRVSFEDFWEAEEDSNPFGDSDPAGFSVTAVPPDSVSDSITTFALAGEFDDAMAKAKDLIDNAGNLSQGQDVEYWLNDEDAEMANVTMQTASQELQRANLGLQDALQTFNTDMQKFQALTGNFSAEVTAYQAEVNTQVQEYQQKLQRYTTEMSTAYQAWAKTESDNLQVFQSDIQNELNEFNLENAKYQASVQESMAEFQSQNQMNIANAERSQNRQLQNSINDMKIIFDNNAQEIQNFTAQLQEYQAEVSTQVQEYTQNLQADSTGYQWLQDQYTKLKETYDQAFMMAAPKQQAQPSA